MLEEYFAANVLYGEEARSILYEHFPLDFIWDDEVKRWKKRKRQLENPETIGRLSALHPSTGDAFYLRLMLKNRAGALSYEDLRTVEGEVHKTFKRACVALGLCESDKQWVDCLKEATEIAVPFSIRQLFCSILVQCEPADPLALFSEFEHAMREDFVKKRKEALNLSSKKAEEITRNDLLCAINDILKENDKSNQDFDLPQPNAEMANVATVEDASEFDPDAEQFYDKYCSSLTNEQRDIFDDISNDITEEKGGLHRLDAPGGYGKTWLSNVLLSFVRMKGKIAIAAALSGIAATMLRLGTTLHRRFGIPIPCLNDSCSKLKINSKEVQLIIEAALIMIDEISMMNWKILNMLDRFLREIMNCDEFMGGKCVVLMGDLRQCPSVVKGGRRPHVVADSITNSACWMHFKVHKLTKNMRIERMIQRYPERITELQNYGKWLLSMGDGTLPTVVSNVIEIPQQMVCESTETLEDKVFDNFELNAGNLDYLRKRAIMSSTNDTINEQNFRMIERLPGEMHISYSRDKCLLDDHESMHDPQSINTVNVSGIPPHRLALKVGALIILIKNLHVGNGHCNGTRYIIVQLTENLIKAENVSGGRNSTILIPRIPMISNDSGYPVPFKRVQFPVLAAYYLTINRAQGQTLERAGLYLEKSVFSHGHLYVGFGRCGDPRGFFVYANQEEFAHLRKYLKPDRSYTRNVFFPELMDR